MPFVSLVVCTINRSLVLAKLFESLVHQDHKAFEVVVVDQNGDDRLLPVLNSVEWPFAIRHIRTPHERGLTRARNVGLKHAKGPLVLFPDDDCWYPPWFLARGVSLLISKNAACVTGRAANESGQDINGRFNSSATWVNRKNVWTTQIEWVAFFRRDAILAVGGYNEEIGVGSATPWSANEGQDITLRLLAAGFTTYYDPAVYGFHAEIVTLMPTDAVIEKARSYGRGFGHVLRRHRYGIFDLAYWLLRPSGGWVLCVSQGKWARSRYYANVVLGRLEGWVGRRLNIGV
jgi:glycosyltransferase involved in cell wall biosynthesis